MGQKGWMFILFIFFVGNMLSMAAEGDWFDSSFDGVTDQLTGYSVIQLSGAGYWALPKMATGFFTNCVPTILLWDYSWLQGSWMIFRLFLVFVISGPIIYELAKVFLQGIQGVFQRFF